MRCLSVCGSWYILEEISYPFGRISDRVRGAYFQAALGRTMMKTPSQITATTMTGTRVETRDDAELEFCSED